MTHDLMRGLKHGSYLCHEQTPSQQNWQHYNSLSVADADSYQTIAHGADTIQFFSSDQQGGCEKFTVLQISTCRNKRHKVFRETAQLGGELHSAYSAGCKVFMVPGSDTAGCRTGEIYIQKSGIACSTKGVFLNFFLQSLELCDKTDYKRNVHQGCTTENA